MFETFGGDLPVGMTSTAVIAKGRGQPVLQTNGTMQERNVEGIDGSVAVLLLDLIDFLEATLLQDGSAALKVCDARQ